MVRAAPRRLGTSRAPSDTADASATRRQSSAWVASSSCSRRSNERKLEFQAVTLAMARLASIPTGAASAMWMSPSMAAMARTWMRLVPRLTSTASSLRW